MKNLKNMLSAAALMVFLGVGAASASTGLLISDKSANQPCSVKNSLLNQFAGVVIVGMPSLDGIILLERQACESNETDGLLISDRDGIILLETK